MATSGKSWDPNFGATQIPALSRRPQTNGDRRQIATPNCHAGGRGFESRRSRLLNCLQNKHFLLSDQTLKFASWPNPVAQTVSQSLEIGPFRGGGLCPVAPSAQSSSHHGNCADRAVRRGRTREQGSPPRFPLQADDRPPPPQHLREARSASRTQLAGLQARRRGPGENRPPSTPGQRPAAWPVQALPDACAWCPPSERKSCGVWCGRRSACRRVLQCEGGVEVAVGATLRPGPPDERRLPAITSETRPYIHHNSSPLSRTELASVSNGKTAASAQAKNQIAPVGHKRLLPQPDPRQTTNTAATKGNDPPQRPRTATPVVATSSRTPER